MGRIDSGTGLSALSVYLDKSLRPCIRIPGEFKRPSMLESLKIDARCWQVLDLSNSRKLYPSSKNTYIWLSAVMFPIFSRYFGNPLGLNTLYVRDYFIVFSLSKMSGSLLGLHMVPSVSVLAEIIYIGQAKSFIEFSIYPGAAFRPRASSVADTSITLSKFGNASIICCRSS